MNLTFELTLNFASLKLEQGAGRAMCQNLQEKMSLIINVNMYLNRKHLHGKYKELSALFN